MKSIGFNLYSALNSMKSKKLIVGLITISLFLGMLFPILAVCYGNGLHSNFASNIVKNYERVSMMYIDSKTLSTEDLKKIKDNVDIESIARITTVTSSISVDGDNLFSTIMYADVALNDFEKIEVSRGNWFSDTDDNVCLVGANVNSKLSNDDMLGKIVSFNKKVLSADGVERITAKQAYRVIGVTNKFPDSVIIPIKYIEEGSNLDAIGTIQYYIKFKTIEDVETTKNVLASFINNNFDASPNLVPYMLLQKNMIDDTHKSIIAIFILVLIVLTYSLINVTVVILNKVDEDKPNLLIRLSLGATRKDVYMQYFFELLSMSVVSATSALLSAFFLQSMASNIIAPNIQMKLSTTIVFLTVVFCIIYSLFIGVLMTRKAFINRRGRW